MSAEVRWCWRNYQETHGRNGLKNLAVELYDKGAIKYGNFVTKIGLQTPIYIDLRIIISYPSLLRKISKLLWDLLDDKDFTHVCGVPYTALPIATVISSENDVPMVIRRKEAKSYGTKKLIEGIFKSGDKSIIVEDIITSGSSVLETVQDLKNEGLFTTTALVIIDREQGGKKNLEDAGIKVKSLFTLTELINFLHEAGKLTKESVQIVTNYINDVKAPLKIKNDNNRLIQSFITRAEAAKNPLAKKLFKIMSEKQTTLCVAADFTEAQKILDLAKIAGPHIAVLKIHIDIIEDFDKKFIEDLKAIANNSNFLIMEDRKFADIGQVVSYQYGKGIYSIANWADFITVHPISGSGVIQGIRSALTEISKDKGIFVVAEMSSEGALTTGEYVASAVSNNKESDLVVGFVCQKNIFENPGLIQLTPGVQLVKSADSLGQQYNTPQDVVNSGGDLIVVGRGITQSTNILNSVLKYKIVLWEAYENRINQSNLSAKI